MAFRVIVGILLLIAGASQLGDRWLIACVVLFGGVYVLVSRPRAKSDIQKPHKVSTPAVGSPASSQALVNQTNVETGGPSKKSVPAPLTTKRLSTTSHVQTPKKPPARPSPIPPTSRRPQAESLKQLEPERSSQPAEPTSADAEIDATPPFIVTRTTPGTGEPLFDPHADHEKVWSAADQLQLLHHYQHELKIADIAETMSVDQRQVAIRLVRMLLSPVGEIDDETQAPNFGKTYSKADRERMVDLHRRGFSINKIASELQRTPLGIGWALLDHKLRIVPVPDQLISRLGQQVETGN